MRQLEGKVLASEGAKPKGKEQPQKYDKNKQGGTGLAATAQAYNADADVVMEDGPKKVRGWVGLVCACEGACVHVWVGHLCACVGGLLPTKTAVGASLSTAQFYSLITVYLYFFLFRA